MSLGSDDMCWGKMRLRSREHLTPLMLLVQVVFPRDSLVKLHTCSAIGSLPPAAKKTKRASKWQEDWKKYKHEAEQEGCFICALQSLWQ